MRKVPDDWGCGGDVREGWGAGWYPPPPRVTCRPTTNKRVRCDRGPPPTAPPPVIPLLSHLPGGGGSHALPDHRPGSDDHSPVASLQYAHRPMVKWGALTCTLTRQTPMLGQCWHIDCDAERALTLKELNYRILIFTCLRLCLATAILNLKQVKITHICVIWE